MFDSAVLLRNKQVIACRLRVIVRLHFKGRMAQRDRGGMR